MAGAGAEATGRTRKLRELLSSGRLLILPGAYDCITARAVQNAGHEALYMTGAGAAAALGYPDYGLVTLTEMADNAGRMAQAIRVPLLADADTGYGNELNTIRTVQEYERRGVAGIHLEDQAFPKKCGHLNDKVIVSREDFVTKIRAAVSARRDPDFLLIARTDARAVAGIEEAIDRVNAALDAGADMAFVEAPETVEEIERIPRQVNGPCLLNVVPGGKTPELSFAQIEQAGYKIAILPGLMLAGAVGGGDMMLAALRSGRHPPISRPNTVRESFSRFGADEWDRYREIVAAAAAPEKSGRNDEARS